MAHHNESSKQAKRRALGAAISAVCASVPGVQAQEATEDAARNEQESISLLEEVIVTATKREANLQDIPMSVMAFTNADIVREGFKQLDDYAGSIPGLAFGRREPGGSNVIMRGCAVSGIAFSDNPTTSIYLDEQPITVAGFNPDPRLIDISRVEALSGPQGTLFGDASQCGTLRIITNKPDTAEREGWVDLTANTVDGGDSGYDISAMFNIPLIKDKLALRLVGFSSEDAGYVDNIFGQSPTGFVFSDNTFDNAAFVKDDVNTSTTTGGRVGLRWQPNEDWTIDASVIAQNTEADGFGDTDLAENFFRGRTIGKWEQMRFGKDTFEDDWYQVSLNLEGDLGWGSLVVSTSFMNRESRYDADSTAYLTAWQERYTDDALYDFPNHDPQAQAFDVTDTDRTSIEIRLSTPDDSNSRWSGIIGAFYNEVDTKTHFSSNVRDLPESGFSYFYQNGITYYTSGAHYYLNYTIFYYLCDTPEGWDCQDPVAPSENWWNGVYDNSVEQTALFGEVTFDLSENFALTLGGRWYEVDTNRRLIQGTLARGVTRYDQQGLKSDCAVDLCYQDTRTSSSESGFVPKINLAYNIDDNRMLYATYSEGFRRGGGNAARVNSFFGRPPYNTFDSDLVKNYEIGAKTLSADGTFRFNITAYRMIWEDIQIEAEDPTPKTFILGVLNFPEAEIIGVEAFADWVPSPRWKIGANVGYNDATLSDSSTVAIEGVETTRTAEAGTRLPLVPDWKFSLSFRYQMQGEVFGAKPSIGLTHQYTGESLSSLSGIQSIEFNNPVRTQKAYSLTDLRYSLDGDDWSATLYVDNAFNKYARQFHNDRWAQTRVSVNQPRTIGVNFRKYFK